MAATKVVNRQLKTDLDTKVDKVLDSSLVADTEIAKLVAISGTNTGDQAIPATGVDFDPAGTDNSDNNAVNTLYSGLVTNATHTSEVTGSGALAVQPIAISNKTLKTTLVGTEEVLINDTTLKKTTTQDIADLVPPATAGAGTKDFIATGTIGAGAVVGLRSDGTVEVIEDTIVDGVFGTAVVFESGFTYDISSVYDSTDKKVMVFYSDKSNSYKGTYIVGDVSGTVITFGTAVIFNSGGADNISSVYDSVDKKVMVFYRDVGNSYKGTYIVYSPEITTTNVLTKIGINTTAKTDAQTATITTIGGTNANQGGLTVGTFYYVQYDGVVTATPNESYDSKPLGFAISATEILLEN